MNDPYSVLGVPQNASDEQIRQAYKELARKYNEQIEANGPLSAAARERMIELDRAYDTIVMNSTGSGGYSGGSQQYYGQNSRPNWSGGNFADVRGTIAEGRIEDADFILDGVPNEQRDAEWYFLKGTVQQRRGWLEEAEKNFATASELEPSNSEYRKAYSSFINNRDGGYRTSESKSKSGCSSCDVCTGLVCADCCCESMGGDLIPCC